MIERTWMQAGPDTRTIAIAALPGAVESAYIVEDLASLKDATDLRGTKGDLDFRTRVQQRESTLSDTL